MVLELMPYSLPPKCFNLVHINVDDNFDKPVQETMFYCLMAGFPKPVKLQQRSK